MPTEETVWEILEGDAQEATATITLVSAESAGTTGALTTLTHPDTTNFPIVTYNRNPDRRVNFDQEPLFPPTAETLRTLGTTQVFSTANAIDDVIVTERWNAANGTASMSAAQFRRIYELIVNQPTPADPEVFVQWQPADRTTRTWNVVLVNLRLGAGNGQLDFKEVGLFSAGTLDAVATGLLDRQVELDLKIVSEVV